MKKNSSDKIPSLQFYPNDWLGDMNLRMCSVGTRGVWIDLICLMHKSQKYGFLAHKVDGKLTNMSPKVIQKLTGMTSKRIVSGIQELTKNDVLKIDDDGLIYSKRMVNDHALRQIRKEVGKLGGNPNLVNQKEKQTPKQKPTPSSSSSFSSSSSAKDKTINLVGFEKVYNSFPPGKKKGRADAEKAWKQLFHMKDSEYYQGPLPADLPDKMVSAIHAQAAEKKWKKGANTFCPEWPLPGTWLRGRRWLDEVEDEIDDNELPTWGDG